MIIGFIALGAVAGFLSGLLGIGGGIIVVSGLLYLFHLAGFSHFYMMRMVIATSLAIMVLTTASSYFAHRRRQVTLLRSMFLQMLYGVIFGLLVGILLANVLSTALITKLFGIFMILMALRLIFMSILKEKTHAPRMWLNNLMGFIVGLKSGIFGIGGGIVSVPHLVASKVSVRQAVLISTAIGFSVAWLGSIVYIMVGAHVALPPGFIGFVYWPAWVSVGVMALLCAPLGAMASHRLPISMLKKIFAVCLILIGIKMLF